MTGRISIYVAVAACTLLLASAATGQIDTYWTAPPGQPEDWSSPWWDLGEPNAPDTAYVNNGGTVQITVPGETCWYLYLGQNLGENGYVEVFSGDLATSGMVVGWDGAGQVDQFDGDVLVDVVLDLGWDPNSSGIYNMMGGRLWGGPIWGGEQFNIGWGGYGEFNHSGGLVAMGQLTMGGGGGGTGIYDLSQDAQLHTVFGTVGHASFGDFTQWDVSTHTVDGGLDIGDSGGHGIYTIHGGTLDVKDGLIRIGDTGTGSIGDFYHNNGVVVADEVDLDSTFGSLYSNGGTLRVNTLTGFSSNLTLGSSLQLGHDGGAGGGGVYTVGFTDSLDVGGDLVIGHSDSYSLNQTNGPVTVGNDLKIAAQTGANAVYTMVGAASTLDVRHGDIKIGFGDIGSLDVTSGTVIADAIEIGPNGTFTSHATTFLRVNKLSGFGNNINLPGPLELGHAGGSASGLITIGTGQTMTHTEELDIGYDATGQITVQGGGILDTEIQHVGRAVGSNGTVTVTGNGSQWIHDHYGPASVPHWLYIGESGTGTLNVLDQAVVLSTVAMVGGGLTHTGGTGHANIDGAGSTWSVSVGMFVGASGTGTVHVTDRGHMETTKLNVGSDSSITVETGGTMHTMFGSDGVSIDGSGGMTPIITVRDPNSQWQCDDYLVVGDTGNGALTVGGPVGGGEVISASNVDLARTPGSTATVNVTGPGAHWRIDGDFAIGGDTNWWPIPDQGGTASLTVSDGGWVETTNVLSQTMLGYSNSGHGTLTVQDPNSVFEVNQSLVVGAWGGTGVLSVLNGGRVDCDTLEIGHWLGASDGTVLVDGPGSTINTDGVYILSDGTGDLDVTGGGGIYSAQHSHIADTTVWIEDSGSFWEMTLDLTVDDGTFLEIWNGARVDCRDADVKSGSQGRVIGMDAEWNMSGVLEIRGNSNVIVGSGGVITSNSGVIAPGAASGGSFALDTNGTWHITNDLTIGDDGDGTLTAINDSTVTCASAVMAANTSSQGEANIADSGTSWTLTGTLTVGAQGDGDLEVYEGASVSNMDAYIATDAASTSVAHVYGTGSLWTTDGQLFVGGDETLAGGTATLEIGNGLGTGGTVTVTDTLKVWGGGSVLMNGGVLNTGRLETVGDPNWDWGGGTVNITSPTFEFVVGASGPLGANLTVPVNNTLTVAGQTTVDSGATLDAVDFTGYGRVVNEGAIRSSGQVTLGDPSLYKAYAGDGILDVGVQNATIHTLGFLELDFPLILNGGALNVPNGMILEPGYHLAASGQVNTRLAMPMGSTIAATGDLTLGDPNAFDGVFSDGVIDVGNNTLTLLDRNRAVLGSLTKIANADPNADAIDAANGLLVEFGKTLQGYGRISGDTMMNGMTHGEGSGIDFASGFLVNGVGDFTGPVTFSGTYTPGFSPAAIDMDDVTFKSSSTLVLEIGGTTPGSDHDQLNAAGTVGFGGVLDLRLINGFTPSIGQQFDLITLANSVGTFDSVLGVNRGAYSLAAVYEGGRLLVEIALPGDSNLDGKVTVGDLGVMGAHWGIPATWETGDLNGDGIVGIGDLGILGSSWGAGTGGPSMNGSAIPLPGAFAMGAVALLLLSRRRRPASS